jgi:PAS domain S-box-containing protein
MYSPPSDGGFDPQRFVAALRASHCGTWRWDIVNNVVDWDEALSDVYGIEHKNAPRTAEEFFALVHPDDRERISDTIRACFESGTEVEYDFRAIVNGRTRWIYDRSQLTRNADGSPSHFTGACLDITERKRIEDETNAALHLAKVGAETSNRIKTEFLANMSHELRTPLNAIIGFSDVIMRSMFGPLDERYRDYAADIFTSGTHLLKLINEILDLSKLEAKQAELCEEDVDLAAIIQACTHLIEPQAQGAKIQVLTAIDSNLPLIRADDRRMRQILINLLSNAVKFTPEGGQVCVSAALTNGGVAIAVKDTGIGMAPEQIPSALEPFQQIDSKISRRYEGTGLGLPLTKHFVELHGGSLTIESKLDIGTTVTCFLPRERIVEASTRSVPARKAG